ncbi:MAG: PQQ-dependent sugar dehydrogenase [Bdellovibrionales bacterium]|jgi:glucose/arabinose dehydrogenase|nr:PQQ-dependent sugar dehydrogenase [Bdellovibrionales bacterium]
MTTTQTLARYGRTLTIALLLSLPLTVHAQGKLEQDARTATKVAEVSGVVWGFDFLAENDLLLSLRNGKLLRVRLPTQASESAKIDEIKGGPDVVASGQGGLLDLKIKKLKDGKTWIYLTASVKSAEGGNTQTTALFRAEWLGSETETRIGKLERLFEAKPGVDSGLHFGSRLAFTDDAIFMTLGERNQRERAQKLDQHWGKVLRLTFDGKPAPGNPFTTPINGVQPKPEIYTWGHRNPQGIAIAPSGEVFVGEHGPRGGDEINLLKPGANYGWPTVTHGREYWGPKISDKTSTDGVEDAVKYYVPSIAPSSLIIYSGKKHSDLKDRFIQGALALQHLNILALEKKNGKWMHGTETRLFQKLHERIRNVAESPSGELYFSTDSGRLYKLEGSAKVRAK